MMPSYITSQFAKEVLATKDVFSIVRIRVTEMKENVGKPSIGELLGM